MSKFVTAFARSLLNIAGGALGVGPIIAGGTVTPETAAGLAFSLGGIIWSQLRAAKTKKLADAVDATRSLPSSKEVENGAGPKLSGYD